jgi:hypothetical protein
VRGKKQKNPYPSIKHTTRGKKEEKVTINSNELYFTWRKIAEETLKIYESLL